MNKSNIEKLFSNLCCSNCKHDFDKDSIIIKREEKGLLVLQIVCSNCGKSFGLALLGTGNISVKEDDALTIQDCPQPISYDDVLDAHEFINKLDYDWSKYIPEDLKNN